MRHVAFLRAVNVAGHGMIRMSAVKAAFERAGCRDVSTFIQSGNVLFSAAGALAPTRTKVERALSKLVGHEVTVCWRTARSLSKLVESDPFAALAAERGVKLYVAFLAAKPRKTPESPLRLAREGLELTLLDGRDVLVVSRSVAGKYGFPNLPVESAFGVPATSRNWNTVVKIGALLGEGEGKRR